MSVPALDRIFSVTEQQQWISGGATNSSVTDREVRDDSFEYEDRTARLMRSPNWARAQRFLKRYIEGCVFQFAKTERVWWSVTAGPGGQFARVNIGPQEALCIVPHDDFHFHALVQGSTFPVQDRANLPACVRTKDSPYAVGDQIWVKSDNSEAMDTVLEVFTLKYSAKIFNLRLMRTRRNTWSRSHCYSLGTAILA
jgi:hypothetical protein